MGPHQFRRLEIARLGTEVPITQATENHTSKTQQRRASVPVTTLRCCGTSLAFQPQQQCLFCSPSSNDIRCMHGRSTKLNVLIEIYAKRFGAALDILAIDCCGKT